MTIARVATGDYGKGSDEIWKAMAAGWDREELDVGGLACRAQADSDRTARHQHRDPILA